MYHGKIVMCICCSQQWICLKHGVTIDELSKFCHQVLDIFMYDWWLVNSSMLFVTYIDSDISITSWNTFVAIYVIYNNAVEFLNNVFSNKNIAFRMVI